MFVTTLIIPYVSFNNHHPENAGAMQDPTAIPNVNAKELINPINSLDFPSYPLCEPNLMSPPVQNPFVAANNSIFTIANVSLLKNAFSFMRIVKRNVTMKPLLQQTVK